MSCFYCLGWESNSGPLTFLGLEFILFWVGIKLRTTNFLTLRFEILHLSWARNELKTTDFLKVRVNTVLGRNQTQDYYLS